MAAGTLCIWCACHRKSIGFIVLQSAESVEHVYNILLTRFPQLPEIIIYDNGCNLYEYILNRSPEFFLKTMIVCDGFHVANHINCCAAFDYTKYPFLQGISNKY